MKSSPHDPYKLGHNCATMKIINQNKQEIVYIWKKSYVCFELKTETRFYEGGIASNHKKEMVMVKLLTDFVHTARHVLEIVFYSPILLVI